MSPVLVRELKTYEAHKSELLSRAEGHYVLIKDNKVHAILDTEEEAVRQGYRSFGNVPFLVKHITEVEPTETFASFVLDL